VVTYSILGSLVKDLVGDSFRVVVSMPNGLDPHEWEPSAKDIETLNRASYLVRNGLNLEGGMEGALAQAAASGVPIFTASDHIRIRKVKAGQGIPNGDADQALGAPDPHLWLDPVQLKAVVLALAADLKVRFGTDLDAQAARLAARLDALDAETRQAVGQLAPERRVLVTGHESLGYFADAYGFTLVGAIVPSLSSQAEVSATDMARLKTAIGSRQVPVLFTEAGTPPKVAQALGAELHLNIVEITTHALLPDGSYFTFFRALTRAITGPLR
jgi:zinc/manganese transport system substrate-binding protein